MNNKELNNGSLVVNPKDGLLTLSPNQRSNDMSNIVSIDGVIAVNSIVLAIYNKPMEFIKSVYGESSTSGYLNEKASQAQQSFTSWWGSLDYQHQQRAVDSAVKLYGKESRDRLTR
jgi:hypothetical protein